MSNRKVLITGGAGFIGSHVLDQALDIGYDVVVIDNFSSGRQVNLPNGIVSYELDIADPNLGRMFAIEKPDVVLHLAAQISIQASMRDPLIDAQSNLIGSINLFENCVKYGVSKIVYCSSGGSVYGEPIYLPCDEGHPIQPLSHYAVAKAAVENYLKVYNKTYDLDFTVLRFSNVFGPRQNPFGEAGVVAIFAQSMLLGHPVTIYGTGEQERDFVYVSDVARAVTHAILGPSGSVYNIGSGIGSTVNDIFSILKIATGYQLDALKVDGKLGEVFRIYLDCSRVTQELGWHPLVGLEDGIARTVDWFRST